MNKKEIQKISISCLLAIATLLIVIFFGKNQLLSVLLLIVLSFLMLKLEWSSEYITLFIVITISGTVGK